MLEYVLRVILPSFFDGLILGASFGLVALGLSIIFGITGVINFSHGDLFMLGSYIGLTLLWSILPNFWISIIVAALVLGAIGIMIERLICRPLYGKAPLLIFVATFGLALFLREAAKLIWSPNPISVDAPLIGHMSFGVFYYPIYRLAILIIFSIVYASVWFFFNKTKYGAIVRAATENSQMLACLGVNVSRVRMFTFSLASALAAVGGMIMLPIASLSPEAGALVILWCFYIIVLGGMGSIGGTVLAAFVIGEIFTLGSVWLEPREMEILGFLILITVLIVRPRGFFGKPLLLE